MREYYTHKSSFISLCCIIIAIIPIAIGFLTYSLNCIIIAFIAAIVGSFFSNNIPASFEADDKKVTFKKGIIKKTINYKDIKSIRCEVVKAGYSRLMGDILYGMKLVITINGEDDFVTITRFDDVTTDMILQKSEEYQNLVNEHRFIKLKKYIDDKRDE
ncbi:MAG: hypothetical protein K2I00_07030 [Ruminococcus sp.]|nr:hypothetical protein [Ruminococcus sp.]